MRTSIRWRLVLMYVVLVIIVMMVSGSLIVLRIRDNEMNNLHDELVQTAGNIQNAILKDESITFEEIKTALTDTYFTSDQSLYANKRVFILDATYKQVILPENSPYIGRQFNTFQVVKAATDGSDSNVEFDSGQKLADVEGEFIGYAENIKVDGKVTYIIYVLGNTEPIVKVINETVMVILLAVGVALLIATVLGFVFADFLTKPIAALSMKARDMARGQLDKPMRVYGNDEIGELTHNFNRMATSLNDTLNEITSEKSKLEIVFKHMTDGILVFDKLGVMIHSNPASIKMLKLGKQISFQEIFKPYLEATFQEIKEMVLEETVSHIVIVEDKYYSIYFAKFLDQNNVAVGLICVIQDITEHKKLEEMQKEFVANVSHELRTPLTTIKTYAETLYEGVDDPEMQKKFLQVINHEGDRMTALVQDLLELSKLDNAQVKFAMNTLNLGRILADSVDKYRIHAQKKHQSMIYHPPMEDCRIIGDANRVEQVIKNIISNAVKYSPDEALIEVAVERKGKYQMISVSDNGFGISEEDQNRIFERFFRVDKARSRQMGGTGLGLAIAKEIMDYHGGKIEVKSELGIGSTFELYFVAFESNV